MATSADYANWLRNNQDKRGTPNYKIVLQAYQEAALEENQAAQAPAPAAPAAPAQRTGFGAAFGKGLESLIGTTTTGVQAATGDANQAAELALKRAAASPYADQVSWDKVKEVYATQGALAAALEVARQAPLAIAEQLPQLGVSLGATAAGAKLGALTSPVTGPVGPIVGGGLGFLSSTLPSIFGSNVERQAAEQQKAGKPLDIDVGAAASAAALQTGAEAVGTLIPLGRTVVGKLFGPQVEALLKQGKEKAAEALARESLGKMVAKGAAVGVAAEVPTEVFQQALERAQAGLPMFSDDALKEYAQATYQSALVGTPLGAAGRAVSRSEARTAQAEAAEAEAAKQRKAARDAEEAAKNTPDYLLKLDADYQAAVKRMQELQAAVKAKPGKDALPDERLAHKQREDELKAFVNDTMRPLTAEYTPRKAEIAQLKERRRVEGMTPFDYMLEQAQEVPAMDPKKLPFTTEDTEIFPTIAPPPRVEPLTAYAKSRIALANEQQLAAEYSLKDKDEAAIRLNIYTDYLLQDPVMAQRLVNSKTAIPDVSARESNAILSSIKLKLQERYKQQAGELAAERPDLAPQVEDVDTFAPWKQAIEAEERLREEEAITAAPVRKEEAVISPERETLIQEREMARRRYFAAAATYEKARGTPDGVRALQQLLAARRQYEELFPASAVSQLPQPTLLPETEAQLNKALEATVGEAPSSAEELEARVQRMADTRKTAIAKVAENAAELDQYERLTRYMGTKQGLSEIARTPEMAEAAKRRMTPMLEQAQASRNEAIAAAIQEIKLQRDLSGLVPLGKTDAELQAEFRDKLNRDLQQAKGKDGYTEKRRQEAVAQQLQRINNRIQQLESGDRVGRLLGYASAFRGQQERTGELSNLYKAYKNLSMQQGLTPQAVQLNRTLQNLIDFYTVGGGAAKPRLVAKGPREVKRELVLGERAFTGYEPTIEGTEVRYDTPRKKAAFKATPEEQALVEDMRVRELAELNEAADRQYTPETSDRAKKQILDELRARIDGFNAPATQEEVAAAQAQAAPQDQGTGDLFAAATERAQAEFQAAGERRTAARSEFGRAMAGMRGKSAIMDQAQRLAEAFGKDLGLRGTYAAAKEKLTKARTEKRAAETEFTEKEQETLRAAADDALIAQREAEAANRAANNTVDAITARLEAERKTPTVEVRTPPRAMVLLRKMAALQALIGEQKTKVVSGDKVGTTFAPVTDVGLIKSALDQAVRAAKEGESWASDIEQVQAHMSTLEKYLSRREAQGRLSLEAELLAKQWYRKLAEHEAALRRPMYGAGQLTPDEIRNYTQRRLSVAQAEYDRIKLQIDGLHRQLLDTEVSVAKREVDRINGDINKLISRTERREGADLANQELQALMAQHKDAVANLNAAQKTFDERKKAESVPFTRKSPAPELEQWMKGAQERFEQSVQRFKDKQAALERQATAPVGTDVTTATERRVEAAREAAVKAGEPRLEAQLEAARLAQKKLKKRGSKKQREAIAEKIADLRKRLGGASSYGEEYYETSAQQQAAEEAREEAELLEAREAGKEETTRAGRRKAAKAIFGVQRTIAETGEVPQAVRDGNKLDKILKSNRQAFEMAVEQGFKSTAIRPQKRGKSATPERVMRTPIEGIAYRLRQEIVEKMAAPQTKAEKKALTELRERLYGLEEAVNTAPVTVEERRRTARAIWAKLPKYTRSSVVDTFNGRTESGGISVAFFDRFADALETTIIRQRLGQPLSQAPVTTMTKAELAPIQAETEKRVAATLKATEELRQKYYEQKEKELADKARLQGQIDEATQRQIEKEAKEFADRVVQRIKEEEARAATRRITEPMRRKPTANVPGEIPSQFSRGPTANPSTTDSVRAELKQTFPDLGRVQIYDTVDALIAANPQYKGKIPADARGFVDSAGNKAFLIAENINQGQALSVLLHEVGAHVGLKSMLGDAQYSALVNAVKSWEKRNDNSPEARVAQAARARVEAAETPARQVNDELLAYAVEEAVNAGVKPMETKGVLGRWLSQIAALFRKALEKFGAAPEKLDAQGLVDLAFGAAQIEMAPKAPQMSRRQFLRGAGAALGTMKLPPLSKDMQLDALEVAWEASMDAARTWFDAAEKAAKTPALKSLLRANNFFDIDKENVATTLYNTSEDLYNHMHYLDYGPLATEEEYRYYTRSFLEEKGVKAVAELQSALKDLYGKILTEAKSTKAPEVGELFFSGTEKPSAFKSWFGDSKVVGAQGKPLVVYHGTDKDFTSFDAEKPKTSGAMHGKGFYFADAAQASSYSDSPSGGGLVMPVYLKMERPFFGSKLTEKDTALLRREMPEFDAAYKKFVAEEGTDEYAPSIERLGVLSGNRNEFIQKALRLAGYDGRIVTDERSAPWTDPDTEYVVFDPTQIKSAIGNRGTYDPTSPNILFSRNLPTAARVANQIVGEQKGWLAKLKDNFLGQGFRMQFVDKYSSAEEVLKRGGADPTKAMQAMYYLRMVDQQMHFTSKSITDGVPERREIIRRDGTKEYLIEAKPGANLKQAYNILKRKDVVKETGSADASNKLATLYMAAIRGERVGYDTLNFGRVWAQGEIKRIEGELKSTKLSAEQRTVLTKRMNRLESRLDSMPTPEDIKAAKAEIDANPVLRDAFGEVRDIYNQYNRDLINFNVQSGALSKEQANKLLQENDYIPYYRMRDGVAELIIGKETPIRIGNLKDSPHLQELVGGDEPIMDFIASSVQNTSMLIGMATHNLAMRNLMFEFKDLGLATVGKVKGGNAPTGAVTFKLDGVEHFAVVDTEALGISSDLLVKGLAGIPTMFPAFVRVMGKPARFLRRMIVASPLYMARQLFRDSLAASIASGANTVPILGALKQIGKTDVLERRGITGGQVFTGMPEDQVRMIKAMQAGKLSITNGLAYLEGKAAQVDALTRRAQYDSYIQQGLSEMEATYMALESMNFSRRGLSPSIHMASTLIPFFNAQIQGLDVLYRSFRGQMPMNERLGVRKKLIARGMMLFGLSIAYAMAMQDDEAYKNAKPEEKYGNWFVSLPGVDQPLRLPIPFELGYVFKALPEALVNIMANEEGGEEAFKALKHIVQQMIPGGSSYMIPAGVKPLLEVGFGVSAYTGRDIESAREQQVEPGYRARESTTELPRPWAR